MKFTRFILAILFSLFALPALAQPAEGDNEARHKLRPKEMHGKMIQMRSRLLREKLEFDAAVVEKIEETLRTYDPRRHELHKKKHNAHRQIRKLLESDSNDQAAYERALTDMQAARRGLSSLRAEEMKEISALLSPKEQAKLTLAFKRMKNKMHRFKRGQRHGKKNRKDKSEPTCGCAGGCSGGGE